MTETANSDAPSTRVGAYKGCIKAETIGKDDGYHVVLHVLQDDGLLIPVVRERLRWCSENCAEEYAFAFGWETQASIEGGPTFLFKNHNDALSFKLRWYSGF